MTEAEKAEMIKIIQELIELADDGYKLHSSNGCHEEFLKEDRTVLMNGRNLLKKLTTND